MLELLVKDLKAITIKVLQQKIVNTLKINRKSQQKLSRHKKESN
jgi:hypothetical protein